MARMGAVARRLNIPAEVDYSLKSCPFCGATAQIEFWHGGRPTKRMISCSDPNEECHVRPSVTGQTKREAIERWERRAP